MASAVDNTSNPAPPPLPTMHTPTSTPTGTITETEATTTPSTPFNASRVVDGLPTATPTSASDGRSQAAQVSLLEVFVLCVTCTKKCNSLRELNYYNVAYQSQYS